MHTPSSQTPREHGGGSLGRERHLAPLRQLEHEEAPHKGDADQGRHAGRPTPDRQGSHQLAQPGQRVAQPAPRRHPDVSCGGFGAHRGTQPNGGEDRQSAQGRQAPGEALLHAGGVDHVAAEIGPGDVMGKGIPARERATRPLTWALARCDRLHRLALAQAKEKQHRQAHAEQGQEAQPHAPQPSAQIQAPLDQFGERHRHQGADQATEQPPGRPGADPCGRGELFLHCLAAA